MPSPTTARLSVGFIKTVKWSSEISLYVRGQAISLAFFETVKWSCEIRFMSGCQ